MIFNKLKKLSITIFIIFLSTMVFFTAAAAADEIHPDPSFKQKTYVHHGNDLILESIDENMFTINGKIYLYTNKTRLFQRNNSKERLKLRDITTPCLINLVYKQYTETTEGEPFPPGTRIIDKLTVIKKIDPVTLESYKNRVRQKTN